MVASDDAQDRTALSQGRDGHQSADIPETSWQSVKTLIAAGMLLLHFCALSSFGVERVALMDFAVDDNSYRSAQTASGFTSLLQLELAGESDIEWVERSQLDLARNEFKLRELELLSGSSSIRPGKWVKADWLVNGKFSLDDQGRRTLLIEITDLAHADVLASETLTFPGEATSPMKLEQPQLQLAAPVFKRLFHVARQRSAQSEQQTIVAPLFFVDLRRFGFKDEFEPLKAAFYDHLEKLELANSRLRMIRFPKAYRAMDESEMVLDGLVESSMASWENMADLYLWATYSNVSVNTPSRTNAHTLLTETRHQLSLHVWDGISAPFTYELEFRRPGRERLTVDESTAFWEQLEKEISKRAVKRKTSERRSDTRQQIAESMVRLLRGANPSGPLPAADRSKFIESVRLIEAACFLAPDNTEAQILRMNWRWGKWMDFQPAIKNSFWSMWRRSKAWGNCVEKFGFAGAGLDLPFAYNRWEVPRIYVDSLAQVLEKFPRQADGFPKDISSERIAEWKGEVEAELAERKLKAEAYLQSLGQTNVFPNRMTPPANALVRLPTNAVARMSTNMPPRSVAPPAAKTNARPAVVQGKARTFPPATPPSAVAQAATQTNLKRAQWKPQFGRDTSLFQLSARGLWPVEVTNVIRETVFPAHFDAKTILKIVPWQGQLIILAVDERSAPTSDLNAEISEELLTRAGHLWLVKEDAPPKLLAAKGMPETVHAFLVESDRLWVAGQNFGYLDLKDQTFHVCQKGEGPEALTDQVVALSGGTIYTLEHFGLTAFDPVLSKWRNLPTPNGRPIYSSGTQSLLESNDRWLCYSAGSQSFYNISAAAWTNLTSVYSTRCLCAQGSGFWIGGGMGLHFYDPERGSLESWRPPAIFSGLRNPWRPLDLKTLAEDPGDVDMGSGFSNMPQTFRKPANNANGTIKFGPPLREPLRLDSRIPGTVNAMLKDGDSLWLAIADRVVLLDLPSRSLMAYRRFGGPVASIGVSDQNVWVGLAYGKQILVRVAKPDFYRVPRDAWKALSISLEERQQLIEKMGFRDKVMYEFYAGDMAGVAKSLETLRPGATNLDLMLLAAFANGPSVAGNPPLARAWCEQIISHHPDSPWSDFAQKELEDQAQNQKIRQHQDWLLEKFDRNHDGVLDDGEKKAMAKSVEFQREERGYRDDLLVPQLQALVKRFDHDGDGKLSARELERVKLAVAFFLETPSEKLERQKAYVTPVLTKSFPSVETLLNKYDINKDGALDADELKAFAKDIQR